MSPLNPPSLFASALIFLGTVSGCAGSQASVQPVASEPAESQQTQQQEEATSTGESPENASMPPDAPLAKNSSTPEDAPQGVLPKKVIQQVINSHRAKIRFCYEKVLQHNKGLEGRVMLQWRIGQTGKVTRARVEESTLNSPTVEECLVEEVYAWEFPKPTYGVVEVHYPFVFRTN